MLLNAFIVITIKKISKIIQYINRKKNQSSIKKHVHRTKRIDSA